MTPFTGQDLVCYRGERTVFQGLDFALEAGGALMLRGPNGSGKSSLLRLMAGLARPLAGVIRWEDADITDDPEAHNRRLQYVGHADPVKPVLTVAENLGFWAAFRAGPDAGDGGADVAVAAAVQGALGRFGIGHLAPVPGRYLSAGQRRRVNLARILVAPAALWLLDEPATALDAQAAKGLVEAIAEHRAGGGMVVVSSHQDAPLEGVREIDLADFQEPAP
ncbi:MAG: heme ABC exporter ATP-binding protein CcmA [Rhodospirillales bacterium]